jgi:gliding motility-associated-like protein
LIGTITQPASGISTGSVTLNGLPADGSWTLTLTPGNITITGSGATKTITGLVPGTYSFKVTNSDGCTSGSSASFEIYASTGTPVVVVTNPPAVCYPSTVDLTNSKITEGSSSGLTYTYWTNAAATIKFNTPSLAPAGTYYIKGTIDGFYAVKPVIVTVYQIPRANAGPDQVVSNQAGTTLKAELANSYETGIWSIISGGCRFSDATNAKTQANGFMIGKNILLWTVTNGVCSSSSDTVMITVYDLFVPTLITPNMDGKNDYLIVKGTDFAGKMELIIFDRRGEQVYKNANYDNSWNGVDYNGRPLSDDTYFYVLRSDAGINRSGYIVIRK